MANKSEGKREKSNKWLRQVAVSSHLLSREQLDRLMETVGDEEEISLNDYLSFCMFEDEYELRCSHPNCRSAEYCVLNPLESGYRDYIEAHPGADMTREKYINMKIERLL